MLTHFFFEKQTGEQIARLLVAHQIIFLIVIIQTECAMAKRGNALVCRVGQERPATFLQKVALETAQMPIKECVMNLQVIFF